MPELKLFLLGSPRLEWDGAALPFDSRKQLALIAYLAMTGQSYTREALITLLWPELEPSRGRAGLRRDLSVIRKALDDQWLVVDGEIIGSDPGAGLWLDVEAFRGLLGAWQGHGHPEEDVCPCCLSALSEAAELYRGDFMAGFSLRDSANFDEWQFFQTEGLRQELAWALERLVRGHSAQGAHESAIPYARRWLALDPLHELAHRTLMALYGWAGQLSAALRQYEECARILEDELGIAPSEETQELHQLLFKGRPLQPIPSAAAVPERKRRPVGDCPYRGLAAFCAQDAPFFFGREAFVDRLTKAVKAESMVAVIVGSSGSGKSSAVFAGLLPHLQEADPASWLIVSFRPGDQPYLSTASAMLSLLDPGLGEVDRLVESSKLAEALDKGDVSLLQVANRSLNNNPKAERLLLVIDQFEELYTLCPEREVQHRFVDTLLAAVAAAGGRRQSTLVLLLMLRADFMAQALTHRPFADALQENSLILGPMTREELRAAIEKPGEVQGAAFEEGLVERILNDVSDEPGNLPLLAFALTLLWERHRFGWLTHDGYEEIGRVTGALAQHVDQVYGELDDAEQEGARRVFVQLVRPGDGTEDTRRLATRSEVGEENWPLVQHLADQRLVVTGRDAAGDETVEVAHEALIQRWGQLQEWMAEDRAFRTWQERLRAALQGWEVSEGDEGALLRGAPLAEAEGWLSERKAELSDLEKEYIGAGVALRERRTAEREAQRQRELEAAQQLAEERARSAARLRRRAVWLGLALVLALIAAGLAGMFVDRNATLAQQEAAQRTTAQAANTVAVAERAVALTAGAQEAAQRLLAETAQAQEGAQRATAEAAEDREANQRVTAEAASGLAAERAEIAISRELAAAALNTLEIDPELGVLLALQALTQAETLEAENALHRTLPAIHLLQILRAHDDWMVDMDISRDGARLATAGADGAKVWNLSSGRLAFATSPEWVCAVALSPDGLRLAVLGQVVPGANTRIEIWGIASNRKLVSIIAEGDEGLAFSPDGSRLAAGGYDGAARVWDATTGGLIASLRGHDPDAYSAITAFYSGRRYGGVIDVAFSPDGGRLATAGVDGDVKIWDLTAGGGQVLLSLSGHAGPILKAAFRPDGMQLATASEGQVTKVWDLAPGLTQGVPLLTISHGLAVAYSSDGTRLATAGREGTAKVWDADTGQEVLTLYGTGVVWYVAFSPDGTRLVTGNEDGSVRVWDLSPDHELLALFPAGVPAFSPDGTRLAIGGLNGGLGVWDLASGEKLLSLSGHTGIVFAVFSPDGTRLASSGDGRTVKVWDAASGDELLTLRHGSYVYGRAFSPDGAHLLTCSMDGKATVWDATTGQSLLTLVSTTFYDCAFSPDGAHLATTDLDGAVTVWDATSGQRLFSFPDELTFRRLAYSPNGARLAAGDKEGTIYVWDITSPERPRIHTLKGHAGHVTGLAFSPAGDKLVTASWDGSIRVWDAASGQELLTLSLQGTSITGVAFSPDGKHLAVGSMDGSTRIYTLDLEELKALAQDRVTRSLTDEECQRYLHLDRCP